MPSQQRLLRGDEPKFFEVVDERCRGQSGCSGDGEIGGRSTRTCGYQHDDRHTLREHLHSPALLDLHVDAVLLLDIRLREHHQAFAAHDDEHDRRTPRQKLALPQHMEHQDNHDLVDERVHDGTERRFGLESPCGQAINEVGGEREDQLEYDEVGWPNVAQQTELPVFVKCLRQVAKHELEAVDETQEREGVGNEPQFLIPPARIVFEPLDL